MKFNISVYNVKLYNANICHPDCFKAKTLNFNIDNYTPQLNLFSNEPVCGICFFAHLLHHCVIYYFFNRYDVFENNHLLH